MCRRQNKSVSNTEIWPQNCRKLYGGEKEEISIFSSPELNMLKGSFRGRAMCIVNWPVRPRVV